jgi:putative MATE family efflux protein
MLQATGRSIYSTIGQITGAVVNIVLDPILIYGWLGLPKMGVKGAAYATVAGQIVSAVLVFIFHLKLNKEIDKSPKYMKPSWNIIKEIYAIGLPAIISQALLTVMTYGLNIILGKIPEVGENAVTVYGLYCKIQQLIIFAAVGLRDAITPIVSFNHGMRAKQRVKEGIKYGLIYTTVLMVIGLVIIEVFAKPLTGFFSLSDTTFDLCVDCMRIVSAGFIFAGINIAFQGVFQALECGIESLIISVGRQVVFILPVASIFARFVTGAENVSMVWWTFLIGETLTLLTAVIMYARVSKKKINGMEES